jgi:hypothetical protein
MPTEQTHQQLPHTAHKIQLVSYALAEAAEPPKPHRRVTPMQPTAFAVTEPLKPDTTKMSRACSNTRQEPYSQLVRQLAW